MYFINFTSFRYLHLSIVAMIMKLRFPKMNLLPTSSTASVAFLMSLGIALTGCVTAPPPSPLTHLNISQTWFDEAEVVGHGVPAQQIPSQKNYKIFLNVHTMIADNEPIIHDVTFDNKEQRTVPKGLRIDGGIRNALDERIRTTLRQQGVQFVESPNLADLNLDVEILKAGTEVLKYKGESDTRSYAEKGGSRLTKTATFLSIHTSINGSGSSYHNTVDCQHLTTFSSGTSYNPRKDWSDTQATAISLIGDRKLSSSAVGVRQSKTFVWGVVTGTTMEADGSSKIAIFSPSGQPTELSIGIRELANLGTATTAGHGDIQQVGEELRKNGDKRLEKYVQYEFIYDTAQGSIIVLIYDYINQLKDLIR